ncbi:MAG TPA: hypothetical protein VD794_14995, partial [Flavisolibacter sp.]|nr:hypothetical protein [Flavisolibacter sp.]
LLWEMKDDGLVRYRCHTGHVFNEEELLFRQTKALEDTFWIALRMMEERRSLLAKMAAEEKGKGWLRSAQQKQERVNELEVHVERLKQLLFSEQNYSK